jgi:hypothetical protein
MNSCVTPAFLEAFRRLSPEIRERTRRAYREWRTNPNARNFKRVGEDVSVRIDRNYRALGYIEGDTVYWYWIGRHDDYDRLLR